MEIIVVGAGAAGMAAAVSAAENGASVTILERNEKAGKKIYITGKGRCNFTNAAPIDDFYANIVTNPKFMYSAFAHFDNKDLIKFIEDSGVKTKVEGFFQSQTVLRISQRPSLIDCMSLV